MREHIDADAQRLDLGSRFVHAAGNSGLVQAERQGQSSADTGADNGNVAILIHMKSLCRLGGSGRSAKSAGSALD